MFNRKLKKRSCLRFRYEVLKNADRPMRLADSDSFGTPPPHRSYLLGQSSVTASHVSFKCRLRRARKKLDLCFTIEIEYQLNGIGL